MKNNQPRQTPHDNAPATRSAGFQPADRASRRPSFFILHSTFFISASFIIIVIAIFITGTLRNPHFWLTADQRGDLLMRRHEYAAAAKTYTDPARIAAAQYRDGQFEAAAHTYARVPGAIGAYDQGTAWLMRGQYDTAVAWYDRALKIRPGWREAEENRALAIARKAILDANDKYRSDEQTNDTFEPYTPDALAFDLKGEDAKKAASAELNDKNFTEDQLRALWLRRVQTTPGDFLRFKFAFQAAAAAQSATPTP